MEHKQSEQLELTENSYYHLQNVFEVILELGYGDFTINKLYLTIEDIFSDFTDKEKKELALKTIKIIKIIN